MRQIGIIVAAVGWLCAGCGGVSTRTEWDEEYSFAELGTYDWLEQEPPVGIDTATVQIVKTTTDDILRTKGYRKDSADPSFLVAFQMGVEPQRTSRYYSNPYSRTEYTEESAQTRLIIDIVDPREREAIWSGSARISVDPTDTHKNAPPIREAVRKLLDGFPPEG